LTTAIIAATFAVLALVGLMFFVQSQRLAQVQDDVRAQEAENAQIRGQIADLREFADAQTELEAKRGLVSQVFANEISWSGALLDISRVIPDASYLTTLAAQTSAATPATPGAVPGATGSTGPPGASSLIGTMTFQGVALGTETVATWLTRLEQVKGWVNPWVTTAQETEARSNRYAFTSGLDLTSDAATERGRGISP
jgi:Tfp pilus assembly protein PilN